MGNEIRGKQNNTTINHLENMIVQNYRKNRNSKKTSAEENSKNYCTKFQKYQEYNCGDMITWESHASVLVPVWNLLLWDFMLQ